MLHLVLRLVAQLECCNMHPMPSKGLCTLCIFSHLPSPALLCDCYRYFDRTGCGFIRSDDLRRLLHNIGTGIPHRMVKTMVNGVIDKKAERLYYRCEEREGMSRGMYRDASHLKSIHAQQQFQK